MKRESESQKARRFASRKLEGRKAREPAKESLYHTILLLPAFRLSGFPEFWLSGCLVVRLSRLKGVAISPLGCLAEKPTSTSRISLVRFLQIKHPLIVFFFEHHADYIFLGPAKRARLLCKEEYS